MTEEEKPADQTGEYSADAITVLEGLEPVRVRPAMYIGDTGLKGTHHLVWEMVDNSIDEALAGRASRIDVRVHKDGSISWLCDTVMLSTAESMAKELSET